MGEVEQIYQNYMGSRQPARLSGFNWSKWLPLLAIGGVVLYFLSGKKPGILGGESAIERYRRKGEELESRARKYKGLAQKLQEVETAKEQVRRLEEEAKGLV